MNREALSNKDPDSSGSLFLEYARRRIDECISWEGKSGDEARMTALALVLAPDQDFHAGLLELSVDADVDLAHLYFEGDMPTLELPSTALARLGWTALINKTAAGEVDEAPRDRPATIALGSLLRRHRVTRPARPHKGKHRA